MGLMLCYLIVLLGACWADDDLRYDSYQPEQVHIAFGEATNEIVVTWSTMNLTSNSFVEYGLQQDSMDTKVVGQATKFVDGGPKQHFQWIHRVNLTNLMYNTTYMYHCGSDLGISEMFTFTTPPPGDDWVVRAAIYGDMGNINAKSLTYLQEETQRGLYDLILHVGDFAYDMDTDDAAVGDLFMRQLQPLAAYVPYMTCPGNHEEKYNFSNYRNRFSMPGPYESMFYSFDLGPVHFISISTEYYYFVNYGVKQLVVQYEWLENDLATATKIENRRRTPWIVVFGHRPMYCSNYDPIEDCTRHSTRTRVGIAHKFGLEKLLYKYGVDIVIWAHEHSYERTFPLYDYQVLNGSYDEPYRNPRAPIHIITGSAGCQEGRDPFVKNTAPWSAFHSNDYGYTRFKAYNHTHVYMEQVSVDLGGKVIDQFWVIKDHHEPYGRVDEF